MATTNITGQNKIQTKILVATVTSDTTMADLTFSNLTIGKWYEVTGKVALRLDQSGNDDLVDVQITHDGSPLDYSRLAVGGVDTDSDQSYFSFSTKFQATATTLTFNSKVLD